MDNQPLPSVKKPFGKNPILWIIVIIISIVIGFVYFATGSVVGCPNTETPESLPNYSQSSTIKFEASTYYIVPKQHEYCSPIAKNIKGNIGDPTTARDLSGDANSTVSPVDYKTTFKLVNRVYVYCHGAGCVDKGNPGDFIILQDEQGNLWRWTGLQNIDEQGQPYTAAHYLNGQRIDNVKPADFTRPIQGMYVGL